MLKYKVILIIILVFPLLAGAEENLVLPRAGLTPQSPFYFLDHLAETVEEWFTFHPLDKAKLNAQFAAERVAEVQAMLETKDVSQDNLDTALNSLQDKKDRAAMWLDKNKEKNILSDEATTAVRHELDQAAAELNKIFVSNKQSLESLRNDVQTLRIEADQAGQTTKINTLDDQLKKLGGQIDLIKSKIADDATNNETTSTPKETLPPLPPRAKPRPATSGKRQAAPPVPKPAPQAMSERDKAAAMLAYLRQEKLQIEKTAADAGVELQDDAFENYNLFMPQIENDIAQGNYAHAEETARLLKDDLDSLLSEIKDYVAGGGN